MAMAAVAEIGHGPHVALYGVGSADGCFEMQRQLLGPNRHHDIVAGRGSVIADRRFEGTQGSRIDECRALRRRLQTTGQ